MQGDIGILDATSELEVITVWKTWKINLWV